MHACLHRDVCTACFQRPDNAVLINRCDVFVVAVPYRVVDDAVNRSVIRHESFSLSDGDIVVFAVYVADRHSFDVVADNRHGQCFRNVFRNHFNSEIAVRRNDKFARRVGIDVKFVFTHERDRW